MQLGSSPGLAWGLLCLCNQMAPGTGTSTVASLTFVAPLWGLELPPTSLSPPLPTPPCGPSTWLAWTSVCGSTNVEGPSLLKASAWKSTAHFCLPLVRASHRASRGSSGGGAAQGCGYWKGSQEASHPGGRRLTLAIALLFISPISEGMHCSCVSFTN